MAILDKDTIARPELWRLVIMIGPDEMDVGLYPPVAREEIIWYNFNIDPAVPSRMKAIEDLIYSNPLLLSDFRNVDCIIDSTSRIIVPADATLEQCERFLAAATSRDIDPESTISHPAGTNARIMQQVEPELLPFLKRTFFNARFHGRLPLLINYFTTIAPQADNVRVTALVRQSRLTIIIVRGQKLLLANDFSFRSSTDAAYYLLSSLQHLGIEISDPQLDISIQGESLTAKGTITEILHRYIPSTKAVPFPTLRFRASKNTLHIPFPILILPICES